VLYILPMMLGGIVLRRPETIARGIFCALLRGRFDVPSTQAEAALRFVFASLSYSASGLFVIALVRNRQLVSEHLSRIQQEQKLRREAEEQLRLLVASSPAAILTLDARGTVLAANLAANSMFALLETESLIGKSIADYVPVLADALRFKNAPEGFRTEAQCQSYRDDGEIFMAQVWFSSYRAAGETRLAAIVVDASEEMRDREEQGLRQLQTSNRIAAAALSHELRTLCGAIALTVSNLRERPDLAQDADFEGLAHLVKGLGKLANQDLQSRTGDAPDIDEVPLRQLDHLRILIEPEWREIDATVRWNIPKSLPVVQADEHGLLQAFLNLMQNSHRAVKKGEKRQMEVRVTANQARALIRLHDSGPGMASPERLFRPFQEGADHTRLGPYISRAMLWSYGGNLRYEPTATGCCFVIELQVVPSEPRNNECRSESHRDNRRHADQPALGGRSRDVPPGFGARPGERAGVQCGGTIRHVGGGAQRAEREPRHHGPARRGSGPRAGARFLSGIAQAWL
jgi:two-component system, LuxR family, sensor kinase FixL